MCLISFVLIKQVKVLGRRLLIRGILICYSILYKIYYVLYILPDRVVVV